MDILTYAVENGCPHNANTYAIAARQGHWEALKYLYEKSGSIWDSSTCAAAAEGGHLQCLRFAHQHGCDWDTKTCTAAAQKGHLECLMYAHERGCPWNVLTCHQAARHDHLECLHYAQSNGCPCGSAMLAVHLAAHRISPLSTCNSDFGCCYPARVLLECTAALPRQACRRRKRKKILKVLVRIKVGA